MHFFGTLPITNGAVIFPPFSKRLNVCLGWNVLNASFRKGFSSPAIGTSLWPRKEAWA